MSSSSNGRILHTICQLRGYQKALQRETERERGFTKPLAEMHRGSGDFPMIEREDSHHACLAAASLKTVEPSRHLKRSHGRENARGKKLLLILFLQNLKPRS
jgi:hypothetical protein